MRLSRSRAELPARLVELPLSALALTVLVSLAELAHTGSAGWLLTVPLVCLGAHLWPRLTFLAPLLGLLLSAALFGLAAQFAQIPVPLFATGVVYLLVTYSAVLLNLPRRALERQLADTRQRAEEDGQALQVMAQLAQLSARSDLSLVQAASCALQLLRPSVALGGAVLFTAGPDGPADVVVLLGDLLASAAALSFCARGTSSPAFLDHTAYAGWRAPRAAPSALALLPLAGVGSGPCLLLRRDGAAARWSVQDRQLLSTAARAARVAAERQSQHAALEVLAHRDALTGCLNRHAFTLAMDTLDKAQPTQGYGVALLDLDGFKALNDHSGHARGDEVLARFAEAITRTCFRRDRVYRLGGDEFAVLLADMAPGGPHRLLERMADIMPLLSLRPGERLGVSVGVAHASEAPGPQAVLALADRRMYDMKRRRDQQALQGCAPQPDAWAAREEALLLLSVALEARDAETHGHSQRVIVWSDALGDRLGLDAEARLALREGAALHDIGKLVVPDRVLLKPGALNDQEWALMRSHASAGHDLAARIPFLTPGALEVVRHHHERWDGTGYPDGLAGEDIPLSARLFAVVDVFDALTSRRPYREAWPRERALAEVQAQAGRHFDPEVVRAFVALWSPEGAQAVSAG